MSYIRHLTKINVIGWTIALFLCCNSCMPSAAVPATELPLAASGRPDEGASPAFSPLYQQIKTLMTRSLRVGEWRPGEAIPSEMELAARFKVSQGTVRKAIDELSAENLLVRRQGKGTFVATHAEQKNQYRFLRLMPDGDDAGRVQRRFIDCRRLRSPADVARSLALKPGDAVVNVRRVLTFNAVPVVFDDIWLPGQLFKGLTAERLSDYKGPMYGLFESEFGVHMIRADEKIRAVAADAVSAPALAVDVGHPLLSVERLSFTYDDKPVELRHGLYNTAGYHYRNALS
jgi:GntR family transcriptional regulator